MLYTVTGYKNTGFTLIDRPSSPSALSGAVSVEFPTNNLWQGQNLALTKINADYVTASAIDYIKITNSVTTEELYYIVAGVDMETEKTAVLSLVFDPLMSVGGISKINILGGWTKRSCPSSDAHFSNIQPESWTPSEQLVISTPVYLGDSAGGDSYKLIQSTVDLYKAVNAGDYAVSYTIDGSGDLTEYSVVVPQVPDAPTPTDVNVNIGVASTGTSTAYVKYSVPYARYYNAENAEVQAGVQKIRSLGIESAITASFQVPAEYIATVSYNEDEGSEASFDSISGERSTRELTELPYVYGTTQNAKAVDLFNAYTILAVASGSSASFKAEDLYYEGVPNSPSFTLIAIPTSDGYPICQPTFYYNQACRFGQNAVKGAAWLNLPIAYNKASGYSYSEFLTGRAADIMRGNITIAADENMGEFYEASSVGKKALGAVQGVAAKLADPIIGAAGTAVRNMFSGYDRLFGTDISNSELGQSIIGASVSNGVYQTGTLDPSRADREIEAERTQALNNIQSAINAATQNEMESYNANSLVAPTISYGSIDLLQALTGNGFLIFQTRLSNNDLQRFDRYLTMYGYAQDKPFELSDLTGRYYFNYIQTQGAIVTNSNLEVTNTVRVNQAIAAEFNQGVRLWHTLPNAAAFSSNPITG